jgi:HK97 family phage major capsid protein
MPVSTTFISRTNATPLIPEEVSKTIIENAIQESAVLPLFTRLPNMSSRTLRMPVLDTLASAYFVEGTGAVNPDNPPGLKQTSAVSWANKYIYAEEIAVIIPIGEDVLEDSEFDVWDAAMPSIRQAIGSTIDSAIIFAGTKPNLWPNAIMTDVVAKSQTVIDGTNVDLYGDISAAMALPEADGFDIDNAITYVGMKSRMRDLRTSNGEPLLTTDLTQATGNMVAGIPLTYVKNGAWNSATAKMILGNFRACVYSIRQDMRVKVLTEATIYDTDGTTILYQLAQRDMVALRITMRLGWQFPNPVNAIQTTAANRYPFAAIIP